MVGNLLPQHQEMLEASAISAEIANQRGYNSITVKAELRRLGFSDSQCLVPTLLIPIWGVSGEIALYHHRPDTPRMRDGKIVKYEFPAGAKMAVDVHPAIRDMVRDPSIPLWITEGAKKCDAAISAGLCCIGLIGVWNWRGTNEFGGKTVLPDWESIALKDRNGLPRLVYLCFDSDCMIKPQVYKALSRLSEFLKSRGANVAFIYLPSGKDGSKVGLDDFLAAGHSVDDLLALASPQLRAPSVSPDHEEDDDGSTIAEKIMALAAPAELFHDERGQNYSRFDVGDHVETWPIRSAAFKNWLRRAYYQKYGKPCGSQPMDDAMGTLEAKAQFDGEEHSLGVRCARGDGSIWIDMADKTWRAIEVASKGWQIVDSTPLPIFRRHASHTPLAEPTIGAQPHDIEQLRRLINVRSERDWILTVVWLIAALIPDIPHPVLIVHGEQGTCKSTLMKMTGRLIDPSATQLRSEPPDLTQWVQAADHSWLVTLDNVSVLPNWLSDALCRAVTGEASSKRQLYTDNEDILYSFRRVIALTGIPVVAQRADLLDRSILLGLEPIPLDSRRPESEVLAEFEKIRAVVTGGLLSALSAVLRVLPTITARGLPRMADFAKIGIAAERAFGWPAGSFAAAYEESIREHNDEALASAITYEPLSALVESEWSGSSLELLESLVQRTSEKVCRSPEWPKNARSLSIQLRRIAPNLRASGFEIKFGKEGRKRVIHITRQQTDICGVCVSTVSEAPTGAPLEDFCDAGDANAALFPALSKDEDDSYLDAIRR